MGAGFNGFLLSGESVGLDGCATGGLVRRRLADKLGVCSRKVRLLNMVNSNELLSDEEVTTDLQVVLLEHSRVATASEDNCVRVWNADTGALEFTIAGCCGERWHVSPCVAWTPDGSLIATSFADIVKVWNAQTRVCDYNMSRFDHAVSSLLFSPDGRRLAIAFEDGYIHLRTLDSGVCVTVWACGPVRCMSFAPDGSRIATSLALCCVPLLTTTLGVCEHRNVPYVPVWDTVSGDCVFRVPLRENRRTSGFEQVSVCFSGDGERVAITDPVCDVSIWNLVRDVCIAILSGHSKAINFVCFSKGGLRVASACVDRTARIWHADTGVCEHILFVDNCYLNTVRFSADDRRLVSSCSDGSARIWNVHTGECEVLLIGHGKEVTDAAFQFS